MSDLHTDLCLPDSSRFVGDSCWGISGLRRRFALEPNWSPTMVAVIGTSKDVGLCLPGEKRSRAKMSKHWAMISTAKRFGLGQDFWDEENFSAEVKRNIEKLSLSPFCPFRSSFDRRAVQTSTWSSRWAAFCPLKPPRRRSSDVSRTIFPGWPRPWCRLSPKNDVFQAPKKKVGLSQMGMV